MFQVPKCLKESMNQSWNFQRSGVHVGLGVQTKKPSVAGVWIFSGITHYVLSVVNRLQTNQMVDLCLTNSSKKATYQN